MSMPSLRAYAWRTQLRNEQEMPHCQLQVPTLLDHTALRVRSRMAQLTRQPELPFLLTPARVHGLQGADLPQSTP